VTIVTNVAVVGTMAENLIEYIRQNQTDPEAGNRSIEASAENSNVFVSLKDGQSEIYLPQVLVELPSSQGSASPTGLVNQMLDIPFGVLIHARDQLEAMNMGDELFDILRRDISSFFKLAKMYRPTSYLTAHTVYPHEERLGEWYSKLTVTFQYFHFGD